MSAKKKAKPNPIEDIKQRLWDELDGTGVIKPRRCDQIVALIEELITALIAKK